MSATLRYDIGMQPWAVLFVNLDTSCASLRFTRASRWVGVGKPRFECVTFAIRLPKQHKEAVALISNIDRCLSAIAIIPVIEKGLIILRKKIALSMGFPPENSSAEEKGFLSSIMAEPSLTTWLVYADWLEERGDPRGELIRAWNGPKAIKCKYGIPLLARKIGGLS